jgi:hypothetical protein
MLKNPTTSNFLTGTQDEIRTAQLDTAHVGDIVRAWGTIRLGDTARRTTWLARLITLLAIMRPHWCLVWEAVRCRGWNSAALSMAPRRLSW